MDPKQVRNAFAYLHTYTPRHGTGGSSNIYFYVGVSKTVRLISRHACFCLIQGAALNDFLRIMWSTRLHLDTPTVAQSISIQYRYSSEILIGLRVLFFELRTLLVCSRCPRFGCP